MKSNRICDQSYDLAQHKVFICSSDMGDSDQGEENHKARYAYVNKIYREVIPSFSKGKVVEDITCKEFDMLERHTMESAVALAYKMLGMEQVMSSDKNTGLSGDVLLMLRLIRYLHGHRVPPELVPGFLILLVKHHFYK